MRRLLLAALLVLAVGLWPPTTGAVLADGPKDLASSVKGGIKLKKGAAINQGYFYSRYSFGALVMASGMGEMLNIPPPMMMEMIGGAIKMVDRGPADGEHVMVPDNMFPVVAVYAGGDPQLVNPMGAPGDLSAFRWDPAKMNTDLIPAAQAQTIIKLAEWAKMFHGPRFGQPTDAAGANGRFVGMLVNVLAKMHTQFALERLMGPDGLFPAAVRMTDEGPVVVDDTRRAADQYQMLLVLSDLAGMLTNQDAWPLFFDPMAGSMFAKAADDLFANASSLTPEGPVELQWAIRSLNWYASSTANADTRAKALSLIQTYGDKLLATPSRGVPGDAYRIIGLVEASRATGNDRYLRQAGRLFAQWNAIFDWQNGLFSTQPRYTVDDVAAIVGALNVLGRFGAGVVNPDSVEKIFTSFFEAAVDRSGLQLAAPERTEMGPGYLFPNEMFFDSLSFRYPTAPTPAMAGGPNGTAPVFASEIAFDARRGRLVVTDRRFDTAGAMHLANEMIWLHPEINGFPVIPQ